MRNGKEVMVLVIMILVVLVSTAKAEDDLLQFEIDKEPASVFFGLSDANRESGLFSKKALKSDDESKFKIWVDSPSSLSDISDDYGLVVTISKSF